MHIVKEKLNFKIFLNQNEQFSIFHRFSELGLHTPNVRKIEAKLL